MASYRSITGVLTAFKDLLQLALTPDVDVGVANPQVVLLGSQTLGSKQPTGNALGLYLHRIALDPYGRNRYLSGQGNQTQLPELPVNLHILLIGWCQSVDAEIGLVGWAMQQIGAGLVLDVSHVGIADPSWRTDESVQIIPEEMSTEDLMRLWDSLPGDYRLSSPYIIKTLRMEQSPDLSNGPPVQSVLLPMEEKR